MPKSSRQVGLNFEQAEQILANAWTKVVSHVSTHPGHNYVSEEWLRQAVVDSINHRLVTYRFCLPIQLLGKMCIPAVDCLKLQRGDGSDPTAWDARSLGSRVVCQFNRQQEGILGDSSDPYVSKPMRQPRMFRDDRSKKDVPGWNKLVGILERVEAQNEPAFTEEIFCQVLLEMYRRQQSLVFHYPIPPRISLENALALAEAFLREPSGGERALALSGALFDAIGVHFNIFVAVNRARINASDEATGQAADLECVNAQGQIVLAVEVKDRTLALSDIEGTLQKSRRRAIKDIFFTSPGVRPDDKDAVGQRVARAFAGGQNLYLFDFIELARSVLALGGEVIRITFLHKIGEHLDKWNTQPHHRLAWKKLLERV